MNRQINIGILLRLTPTHLVKVMKWELPFKTNWTVLYSVLALLVSMSFTDHVFALDPDAASHYRIVFVHSSQCLTIVDGSARQMPCFGGPSQEWRFAGYDVPPPFQHGVYQMQVRHTGECLDVPAFSTAPRTPLQQFRCKGKKEDNTFNTNQLWVLRDPEGDGTAMIMNVNSELCLNVRGASGEPGAIVQQFTCDSTATNGQVRITADDPGEEDHPTVYGAKIRELRLSLQGQIWGGDTLPSDRASFESLDPSQPDYSSILEDVGLQGVPLAEQYRLRFSTIGSVHSRGFYFKPTNWNNTVIIVHGGHACGFTGHHGFPLMIQTLIHDGFSVAALLMPGCPSPDLVATHNQLFKSWYNKIRSGNFLRLFLDPVLQTVNLLTSLDATTAFGMVGLSGGGWTTTVYSALDTRIAVSVPVAGTRPRSLACGLNPEDPEQRLDNLVPDNKYGNLYVLGSDGGRRQVQILNFKDDIAFPVMCSYLDNPNLTSKLKAYELEVQARTSGSYHVCIDRTSSSQSSHQISAFALTNYVMPALSHRAIDCR